MSTAKYSSIVKKVAMALSGLFLVFFLAQHLTINLMSVFSAESFNEASHFMGTNPLVQYVLQPVLAIGVFFHLILGIVLEIQNRRARPVAYAVRNGAANATWQSRNMIVTGITILLFLGVHFYDFWIPELNVKYLQGDMSGMLPEGGYRYFEELQHKFHDPIRVGLYVLSFVFLSLHLLHGFASAFQSLGARHPRWTAIVVKIGKAYAILVPAGFILIAIYHFTAQ